jgi:hypothetical protein
MEKKISWERFDGMRFQEFCNALLFLTISKRVRVFSAPGPDGGVDQYFEGAFAGKTGKWRFQDKFKSVSKSQALASLKRDIEEDIKSNVVDEDIIVYLTNIDLTKPQTQRLIDAGKTALAAAGCPQVEVEIWHHADLSTHVATCPLLYNWFWESGASVLERYETYFDVQLNGEGLAYQLHNPFIGRTVDLATLTDFLSSDRQFLTITGQALMGKTKLVLEFFRQVIDTGEDWIALVVKPSGFSAASFSNLMQTQRKMVLLLDDVHQFPATNLRDIKAEVDKCRGRIKCILTTRDTLVGEVRTALPTHSRNPATLPLRRLTPAETKSFYRLLLPWLTEPNLIYLSGKSQGVPGMILNYCRLVGNNAHPDSVTEEDAFQQNVEEILQQAIGQVEKKTHLPGRSIRNYLELLALIGPVTMEEEQVLAMASLLGMDRGEMDRIERGLIETGLVNRRWMLAIKPDAYGEMILKNLFQDAPEALRQWLMNPHIDRFHQAILTNLSVTGLLSAENRTIIGAYIEHYLAPIADSTTSDHRLEEITETFRRVAYRLPDIGEQAINRFITANMDRPMPFSEPVLRGVNRIFRVLIHRPLENAGLHQYYGLLEKWIRQTGSYGGIHACFGFGEYDLESAPYRMGDCCQRQLYLTGKIQTYFTATQEWQQKIALAAFDSLWVNEFFLEEIVDPETLAFIHGQSPVTDCSHVRRVREQLLEGIIAFYQSGSGEPAEQKHYLDVICRVLLFMFDKPKDERLLDQTTEVDRVLRFLHALLDGQPTLLQKAEIGHVLEIGKIGTVKSSYSQELTTLKTKVRITTGNKEALELFLITINYNYSENEARIEELAADYSPVDDFILDLRDILQRNNILGYTTLMAAVEYLAKHHLPEAKSLYSDIITSNPMYIPVFSRIVDYCYTDEDYVEQVVAQIWNREQAPSYRSTALAILLTGERMKAGYFRVKDLDYVPWVIAAGDPISKDLLAFHLYHYADLVPDRTFSLLRNLVGDRSGADTFFYHLCRDTAFCGRHKDRIYELIEYAATKKNIFEPTFTAALDFLYEEYGLHVLFEFIVSIMQAPDTPTRKNGSWSQRYRRTGRTETEAIQDFFTWLEWVAAKKDVWDARMTETISQLILPDLLPETSSDPLESEILSRIDAATDPSPLFLLATALQGYQRYTPRILRIQCRLADLFCSLQPDFTDVQHLLGRAFYRNNEGSKSGLPGQPYREDLVKKKLLEAFLEREAMTAPVRTYLEGALQVVQADIDACMTAIR